MALNDHRLVRVPNAEAWIEKNAVVAVARQADSTVRHRDGEAIITMVNFSIRLVDGKTVNLSSPDRTAVSRFLLEIGVLWEG